MKIGTTIKREEHVQVNIPPAKAIKALRHEITRLINEELGSLSLPREELKIPPGGFDFFYLGEIGELRAHHTEGRHPRETETDIEIKWGVERFKRMLYYQSLLSELGGSDVFPKA